MTTDSSKPITPGPRPDWRLPAIIGIEIRRIDYEPRRLRHFESALSRYKEVIEFIVQTDGPVPARALGPALFVAGEQVNECEQVADNTYRFLAFELERLEAGAPISWGWMSDPEEERQETSYRLEL
jgi:hypothetical protein